MIEKNSYDETEENKEWMAREENQFWLFTKVASDWENVFADFGEQLKCIMKHVDENARKLGDDADCDCDHFYADMPEDRIFSVDVPEEIENLKRSLEYLLKQVEELNLQDFGE